MALAHGTFKTPKLQARADRVLAEPTRNREWRSSIMSLFDDMFDQSEFQISLALPCFDMLGMNFLKKSPSEPQTSQYYRMRDQFLACIDSGLLSQPHAEMHAEIKERQKSGAAAVGR